MKRTKKMIALSAITVLGVTLTASACTDEATKKEYQATDRQEDQYLTAQPPHAYDASQARENLIAAQDAMAYGADTWTVQYVEGVGITFECPSVGFPIPFGTNITNPSKIEVYRGSEWEMEQMEPYGLYPPADVDATYGNCVLPDGTIGIFYSEPLLTGYGFDVEYNAETGRYEIPSDATAEVSSVNLSDEDVKQGDE